MVDEILDPTIDYLQFDLYIFYLNLLFWPYIFFTFFAFFIN